MGQSFIFLDNENDKCIQYCNEEYPHGVFCYSSNNSYSVKSRIIGNWEQGGITSMTLMYGRYCTRILLHLGSNTTKCVLKIHTERK